MRDARNIIWGTFLIVIGVLLLMERIGGLQIPVGSLWPLVLFVLAASSAAERNISGAVMFTLLGLVFLSVTFNWFGLSYHRSWPLLMVAAGIGMVIRSLTGARRIAPRDEVPHE